MPLSVIDVIPNGTSAETNQNSEPSLAVNPINSQQIVAADFGGNPPSYFSTVSGGTTWSTFGSISHGDTTEAWLLDGSRVLAATLEGGQDQASTINTYSATLASGNFGAPINTFTFPGANLDQPWIRIGPNRVYVAYNNLSAANGQTAAVNVSSDGGNTYPQVITLDRVGATSGQDGAAERLAVSGNTVYAVFDRWNDTVETGATGTRYNSQLVVVKTVDAGADGFTAIGVNGNGVVAANHIAVFSNTNNTPLTIGQERIAGGDIAIAVDPNDANHVVVVYTDAPGANGAGIVQLVVTESTDGGLTWSSKFSTAVATRSGQPGIAILTAGVIGLLYDNYDPATNRLSQHFVTTVNDFLTVNDVTLGTESNATPALQFDPYLGDYFDLTSLGATFYGIFSASNADNGADASFQNVTFQRSFSGTPGTNTFQLTSAGNPVGFSIDPFFFSLAPQFVASGVVSSGATVSNNNILEVQSGGTANVARVNSGGVTQVDAGGVASGTTISGGGFEVVFGSESNATVSGNGLLRIFSGGTASGTRLAAGGFQITSSGGNDVGTRISGVDIVASSGLSLSATVFSGALAIVKSGGVVSGATVSGGLLSADGLVQATTVSAGGAVAVVSSGTVRATTVSAGGTMLVSGGGTDSGSVIGSGGYEQLTSAAVASGGTVNRLGLQYVGVGAVASGTSVGGAQLDTGASVDATVTGGGTMLVLRNGIASGMQVSGRGATALVLNGGSASGISLTAGGLLDVIGGGTVIATQVNSAGRAIIGAGATTGAGTISGGILEIARGASVGSSTITFASSGGGVLQLDNAVNFGGLVAGFAQPDLLDLRDVAFGSGTTLSYTPAGGNASGTLSVSDGINTANITLIGQYSVGQFTKGGDGHGGTVIGSATLLAAADLGSVTVTTGHTT